MLENLFYINVHVYFGLPQWLSGKESACNARVAGSILGTGNLLQYSRLENPKDRGAWQATVDSVTESDVTDVT